MLKMTLRLRKRKVLSLDLKEVSDSDFLISITRPFHSFLMRNTCQNINHKAAISTGDDELSYHSAVI